MNTNTMRMFDRLANLGIAWQDRIALRRIQMTLHRWNEMECGDEYGNCVERDDDTGIPYRTYDVGMNGKRGRTRIPDREKGALKRLGQIMAGYADLVPYVQGDPRGCALYILRRSDVDGQDIKAVYTRGVAVCD